MIHNIISFTVLLTQRVPGLILSVPGRCPPDGQHLAA